MQSNTAGTILQGQYCRDLISETILPDTAGDVATMFGISCGALCEVATTFWIFCGALHEVATAFGISCDALCEIASMFWISCGACQAVANVFWISGGCSGQEFCDFFATKRSHEGCMLPARRFRIKAAGNCSKTRTIQMERCATRPIWANSLLRASSYQVA